MDFNFRQYDPQITRFLSVDPLTASTDRMSPYTAMNNQPESMTDPHGLKAQIYLSPSPNIIRSNNNPLLAMMPSVGEYMERNFGYGRITGMMLADMEYKRWLADERRWEETSGEGSNTGSGSFATNLGAAGGGSSGGEDGGPQDKDKDENGYSKKSSLYKTPNGEGTHTVQEWADHYEGKSWDEITRDDPGDDGNGYRVYLKGLVKFRAGPRLDWRYVKLDDNRILDMRHVLVVGMASEFLGSAGEYAQYGIDKKSANSTQDFVSNAAGAKFLQYLQSNAPYYNSKHSTTEFGNTHQTNISQYFYKSIYGL